jgi:hypothetical protein
VSARLVFFFCGKSCAKVSVKDNVLGDGFCSLLFCSIALLLPSKSALMIVFIVMMCSAVLLASEFSQISMSRLLGLQRNESSMWLFAVDYMFARS